MLPRSCTADPVMHGPLSHTERPELVDRRDLSLLVDRRKERGEREERKERNEEKERERGEILLSSVLQPASQQASKPLMQLKRKVVVL